MSFSDYWGGWACFCISIVMIGVLTAFIGDLASHFGCTIGLKDAITAISFVALGTSVPGRLFQFNINWYGKCTKTLNTFFSFCFQIKCWLSVLELTKCLSY